MGTIYLGVSAKVNIPPTANAGVDQVISAYDGIAILSGSGTDTDGTIVSYLWTQVSGPSCTITNPNSASTTVTGMSSVDVYTFRLAVTDNSGDTGQDEMSVNAVALEDAIVTGTMMEGGGENFRISFDISIPVSCDINIPFSTEYTQGISKAGPEGSLILLAGTLHVEGDFGDFDFGLGTVTEMSFTFFGGVVNICEGRDIIYSL